MKEILYISPEFKNSRGGIGLCVNNYAQFMPTFKILVTNSFRSKLLNFIYFPVCICHLFFKLITDKDIKIIHIHGASKGSFYRKYILFIMVRSLFRKKVIYHMHGGGFRDFYNDSPLFIQKRIRYMINSSDLLICLSQKWKDFFTETFYPKRIEILNNMVLPPVNTDRIESKRKFRLFFLGLIGDNKGIFDLLEVIAENKEQFGKLLILKVAGNGEIIRLEKRIKELGIDKIVQFQGWVDSKKKEELFRSSDALILPSYKEGLPLSILEAMSYGLPIISSDVGGIPDLLLTHKNGILLEPGNKLSIQQAIMSLVNNKDLVEKFSKRSIEGVAEFYPQSVLKKLNSIYDEL
ncbi:glycosyltransferase family 4 protein [Marinifilum sp. RC60d5]|uniref:glycosyltransferase family 4 protein n=1 Tax=Marinifilum sp. RC60d5 TaxID=3458414 RepID=UPI0040359359